jgi:hypothetical protein
MSVFFIWSNLKVVWILENCSLIEMEEVHKSNLAKNLTYLESDVASMAVRSLGIVWQ